MATTSPGFVQHASRVHTRLLDASRRKKKATFEIAHELLEVERHKLFRAYNRTSTGDYAVFYGITRSAGNARDLVGMAKDLEHTPKIRAALERGELDWTKARTAAAAVVANPGSEDVWLPRALTLNSNELEAKALEEKGEPAPIRRPFKFSREQYADVEQTLARVRAVHGRKLTDEEALVIALRGWSLIQAGGGADGLRSSDNPANRLVVTRCGDCGKAWRETRSGRVEVSPANLEAHGCDSEVSDVRDGPARITKTVPPKTRRHVLDRDGHRCRVPGCPSVGYLHVHHEGGREVVGHDPARLAPLCDEHHTQRHLKLFEIREDADVGLRFFRPDGTELTGAPGEVAAPVSREAESRPPEGSHAPAERSCERPASAPDRASGQDEDDAGRALVKLRLSPREAARAVSSAREALVARGEAITLESLLREALIALPGPEPMSAVLAHVSG